MKTREEKRQYAKRYYKSNRDEVIRKNGEYAQTKKEELAKYRRNWTTENWDKVYHSNVRRRYGLSRDEYLKIFRAQKGKCAICGCAFSGEIRKRKEPNCPHVDHCKIHGHVRGLLCLKCNLGIGFFRYNSDFLRSAIRYVEKEELFLSSIQ